MTVVGRGRLGTALAPALRAAGVEVTGPLGRGAHVADADVVVLCVPDREIAPAASLVPPGPIVGHCSGATGLEVLAPHEAFSLHPLMTLVGGGASFAGAGAAVAGTTARARRVATHLARALELSPIEVADRDRAAYHGAAAMASNFLVTLEVAAEHLAVSAGVDRAALVPLVRTTVENWARLGAGALTGPIARGDHHTVAAQRAAVAERAPDLVPLFDALVTATRALAEPEGAEGG